MRMRRLFITLPIALLLLAAAALPAHAANLPLLDPNFQIVPDAHAIDPTCPVGAPLSYAGVLQLIQNVMNAMVSIGLVAFVLVLAYAGFSFIVNPTNPEARTKARSMLINVVVGLVIVLGAWLFVDFIMKALTGENGAAGFGPWNSILSDTADVSPCIHATVATPLTGFGGVATGVIDGSQATGGGQLPLIGQARGLCSDRNSACNVSTLQSIGLTDKQAQAMSCIAMTESSGNPNTPKSSTGACGTFQITTRPGNWSKPAYHQGSCTTATSCNDATCNMQTAVLMYKDQGYQPWTGHDSSGKYWNPNAVACVNKYDPGQ